MARLLVVGAGEAGQPQRGALDRDRGVALGQAHDRFAGPASEAAGPSDRCRIEVDEGGGGAGHLSRISVDDRKIFGLD